MKTQSIINSIAVAALLVAGTAPLDASAQQTSDKPSATDARRSQQGAPTIHVTNHNWLDMHVYVSRDGGALIPVGVVGTNESMNIPVPAGILDAGASIRIVADPIGGSGMYVSPDLNPGPGDEVVVTIENAMNLSWVSLRAQTSD